MIKNRIILLGLFISLFCLTSCVNHNARSLDLPGAGQIERVELEKSVSGALMGVVEYMGSYSDLASDLASVQNAFSRESVNDQPSGVDEYIVIRLYSREDSDSPSVVYAYLDGFGRAWIEQPYIGIWKVSNEVYGRIAAGCDGSEKEE